MAGVLGASAAALYTHYTAVFPLAAQLVWALVFRRDRVRAILAAHAAVALAYLPWLPYYLEQRGNGGIRALAAYPLTPGSLARGMLTAVVGHPYAGLGRLPGRAGLALIVLGGAFALAGLWARARSRSLVRDPARAAGSGGRWSGLTSDPRRAAVVLLLLLALSTAVGIVVYRLGGTSIYAPRNLTASLPPTIVLLAAGLMASPRRLAAPAVIFALAGLAVGALQFATEPRYHRPALESAAQLIDARAAPRDAVVQAPVYLSARAALQHALVIYLHRRHALFAVVGYVRRRGVHVPLADPRAWGRPRAFVVGPIVPGELALPTPPPTSGLRLTSRIIYPGLVTIAAATYDRAPGTPTAER